MLTRPKIALVAGANNSATNKIMRSMKPYLEEDFEVDVIECIGRPLTDDLSFSGYDHVHFGWIGFAMVEHAEEIIPSVTANIWQIATLHSRYREWLDKFEIDCLVVDDRVTRNQLGQIGYTRTKLIPLAFEYERKVLPFPTNFTLGYFGNHYNSKRFEVVDAAGEKGNFAVAGFSCQPDRPVYSLKEEDVYGEMSVYVQSSFHDTNCMPAMEALHHGRPVISVWSDGLSRVLTPHMNGLWYDGTVEDLIRKANQIKNNFEDYREGAEWTEFPSVKDSAEMYKEMFHEILEA